MKIIENVEFIFSRWYYPRRYVVAFMAFLGFCNVYAMRVNLSVAIVAMTTNKTLTNENGTFIQVRLSKSCEFLYFSPSPFFSI